MEINGFWVPDDGQKYYLVGLIQAEHTEWKPIPHVYKDGTFERQAFVARTLTKQVFREHDDAQQEADRRNAELAEAMKPKRWMPNYGEPYALIGASGFVIIDYWDDAAADHDRHRFGNCFKTEDASAAAKELREWLLNRAEPKA